MAENKTIELTEKSSSPKGGWGWRQRFLIGLNVVIMVIIALGILIAVNYLAARHYLRQDITFSREFSLSEKTKQVLNNLKEPITVYFLVGPADERLIAEVRGRIRDMLEEYKNYSAKIKVEFDVSESKNPALVSSLQKILTEPLKPNTLIVSYGTQNKVIDIKETYEPEFGPSPFAPPTRIKTFKGEEVLTNAILSVTSEKKVVGFLEGHDENDIYEYAGAGYAVINSYLKLDNLETKKINLVREPEKLAECSALVIAGPKQPITKVEWDAIQSYLDNGGGVLIMIDPFKETGAETFLRNWGIELSNDLITEQNLENCPSILTASGLLGRNRWWIMSNNYSRTHPITQKFSSDDYVCFPMARSVSTSQEGAPDITAISLVETAETAWGETDLKSLQAGKPKFTEGEDIKGPLSFGFAVTKKLPAGSKKGEARLVVFGNSSFINNDYLLRASSFGIHTGFNSPDLFMNSIRWLIGTEALISIEPKHVRQSRINLTPTRSKWLFWISIVALPLFSVILGIIVWWIRRR